MPSLIGSKVLRPQIMQFDRFLISKTMDSLKTEILLRIAILSIEKLSSYFQCYKNNFIQYLTEEMTSTMQVKSALPTAETSEQKLQMIAFFKSYLRCLKKMISNSRPKYDCQNSIFDLIKTPLNISLESFLQRVISYFKCGIQAYICALCFIDRFLESETAKTENITLTIKNIFKIVSVALLISTKNFDDFYYANTYYARVCGLSLQEINQLQKQFLKMIDFDVFINAEEYKIYQTIVQNYKSAFSAEPKQMVQMENIENYANATQLVKRDSDQYSRDEETTEVEDINIQVKVVA